MSECRAWSEGDPILESHHDHEWRKINHDDDFEFEMLCPEGASVWHSWQKIMHKREAYRAADGRALEDAGGGAHCIQCIRKDERGHEEGGHRLRRPGDHVFVFAGHRDRERPFGGLRIQVRRG